MNVNDVIVSLSRRWDVGKISSPSSFFSSSQHANVLSQVEECLNRRDGEGLAKFVKSENQVSLLKIMRRSTNRHFCGQRICKVCEVWKTKA